MTCLIAARSNGFLLSVDSDTCPAPPPCTCEIVGNFGTTLNVHCGQKNLSSIPMFKNASRRTNETIVLWLNENNISTVPQSAFLSLRTYTYNNIIVSLNWNRLYDNGSMDVNINAFTGIEEMLIGLYLRGARLTAIPKAIAKLKRLEHLDLKFNSFLTVDVSILLSIHQSLQHLEISLRNVTSWPSAFQYLTSLVQLEITHFYLSFPLDAFIGINSTLEELRLAAIELPRIPSAVCSLQQLRKLFILFDNSLLGRNMLHCNSSMTAVKELVFHNTTFQLFPDVFKPFPNLESLSLTETELSLIDDSVIPTNSNLTYLYIEVSKLAWIPGAVNEFPSLQSVTLSNSLIRSVERHSFVDLQQLHTISLSNNPIEFISDQAFWNLPALTFLDLSGAKLTTIPDAVQTILPLSDLSLYNNEIVCDCNLSWLNPWISNSSLHTYVDGTCSATNEGIYTFLTTTLQQCP